MELIDFSIKTPPSLIEKNKLYIDRIKGYVAFRCPCEKSEYLNIPSTAWDFTELEGKLSLHPSIMNMSCKTHFYIIENEFVMV